MRTVVAFDVSDDRARAKVAKCLLEYGQRVQKSVFECPDLTEAQYFRMRSRLEGLIDSEPDSLRYYRLCEACVSRIDFRGVGPGQIPRLESFEIIGE